MTEPENPWQPDNHPAVQPWTPPPGYPMAGYGWPGAPPPPRRPFYRAPGTLIGAATFSAVSAWFTLAGIGFGWWYLTTMESASAGEAFTMFVMAFFVLPVVLLVAFGGFCMTVAGAAATVPLAVIWFRSPDRNVVAGLHLIHAVVSWAALAIAVVWLPL